MVPDVKEFKKKSYDLMKMMKNSILTMFKTHESCNMAMSLKPHERYVSLKVQKSAQHYTEAAIDEITILKQIVEGDPDDKKVVVKLLDNFKHSGPNGLHVCMVFEFLGDNLLTLIKYTDYRGVPLLKVKEICFHVLGDLDYLHRHLSIIHTCLKLKNILILSMIDPKRDRTKTGAPLILSSSKDNNLVESGGSKEVKVYNGDLTKNQKKKIKKKVKKAAQNGTGKEESDEAEVIKPYFFCDDPSKTSAKYHGQDIQWVCLDNGLTSAKSTGQRIWVQKSGQMG
uniref:non-specific serine/threonine protein kinase n=1 Tax=Tanacetum cinerariifolium TaxID=118510 RepID=A0A699H220_TANCI|nr:serine/threonine-protein kinase SRPK-like [Tanacetum cinerariifolium]